MHFGDGICCLLRIQLPALGHVKSTVKGAHPRVWQKFFAKGCDQCYCVYWVRVGCNVMPVCLPLWLALAINQTVSVSHPWLLVDFQKISVWTVLSLLLGSAEASESRTMLDSLHRVGSQRWLKLARMAAACSDPLKHAQRNCIAHALWPFWGYCEFVAHSGSGCACASITMDSALKETACMICLSV